MRNTRGTEGVSRGGADMNELIDLSHMKRKLTVLWAGSLGVVIALVIGYAAGHWNAEARIIDDCKFNQSFRTGIQSFTCMRKI
jgi:hypothetical protein